MKKKTQVMQVQYDTNTISRRHTTFIASRGFKFNFSIANVTVTTSRQGWPEYQYPTSLGVPLHRRGTSKTYEHLEDLLQEVGYKETHVFTPENGSRQKLKSGRRGCGSVRGGVGAVVGFLTGLSSRTSSLERDAAE